MAQARAPRTFAIRLSGLFLAIAIGSATSAGCGSSPAGPSDASPAGAVAVEAGFVVVLGPRTCPGISSFMIDNVDLAPGQIANASVVTVGPAPSFTRWAVSPASSGTFSDATSAHTGFTCTGTGAVTVAVQVGLVVEGLGNVCEGVPYTSYEASVRCAE